MTAGRPASKGPGPADPGDVRWNAQGFAPVVVQDASSGAIRMLAWADAVALDRTLATGLAHFFSRSRKSLWLKGESSGNHLRVLEVWLDCDADALLYRALPEGPTCHTGAETCFYRRMGSGAGAAEGAPETAPGSVLHALGAVLSERRDRSPSESYVSSLLSDVAGRACAKVLEEAEELAEAVRHEGRAEVVHELADLVFHALVAAFGRGVEPGDLSAELQRRFGVGGHEEKAARSGNRNEGQIVE